jgi:hypothetical protein
MLIDTTYREEFLGEIIREMRATFGARAEYLRLRASLGSAEPVLDEARETDPVA